MGRLILNNKIKSTFLWFDDGDSDIPNALNNFEIH